MGTGKNEWRGWGRLRAGPTFLMEEAMALTCGEHKHELVGCAACFQQLQEQNMAMKAEIGRWNRWTADLQSGMYINCVYCGHRYGPSKSTPASMADVLKEHIENCPKHPMSTLKRENTWLRAAHLLLAQEHAFIGMPDGGVFFVTAEVTVEGTPLLALNMNDTFAYACADAEPFNYEDAPELLAIAEREGWPGLTRWAMEKRAERGEPAEPIKPVQRSMNIVDELRAKVERYKRREKEEST